MQPWTDRKRDFSYVIPKSALVKANRATEKMTFVKKESSLSRPHFESAIDHDRRYSCCECCDDNARCAIWSVTGCSTECNFQHEFRQGFRDHVDISTCGRLCDIDESPDIERHQLLQVTFDEIDDSARSQGLLRLNDDSSLLLRCSNSLAWNQRLCCSGMYFSDLCGPVSQRLVCVIDISSIAAEL